MTLANMSEEIKLRKIGEPEFNSLPRGVYLIMIGDKPVFARRVIGRLMPVSPEEQKALEAKHIVR